MLSRPHSLPERGIGHPTNDLGFEFALDFTAGLGLGLFLRKGMVLGWWASPLGAGAFRR